MLRRIGFRHVLPPVQLLLYCVLSLNAYWARLGQQPCSVIWSSSQGILLAQEGDTVTFSPPCREPTSLLVAGSLNLPAQLAGLILAATLHRESDAWSFAITAPMVVILWYLVGLWIDRRLGRVAVRRGRFPRILAKAAYGFSILMVLVSAILIARAFTDYGHRIGTYFVVAGFASWSVFLLMVTSANLRRGAVSRQGPQVSEGE